MGWSSGNEIFDPIAQVTTNLDHTTRLPILARLIDNLQENDWDTEEESLGTFRYDLTVVAAFYLNDVCPLLGDNDDEGEIRYGVGNNYDSDPTRIEPGWRLTCNTHGQLDTAHFTPEGHNGLLTTWVQHDAAEHDGTGSMDDVQHHHLTPTSRIPIPDPAPTTQAAVIARLFEEVNRLTTARLAAAYAAGTPAQVIDLLLTAARAARNYIRANNTAGTGNAADKLAAAINAIPEALLNDQ